MFKKKGRARVEPATYRAATDCSTTELTPQFVLMEWQRVRVVKEVDSKSTGLCPREFKARRCRSFVLKGKKSTSTRFELARAEPSRFLIYLLNHSDTTSSCQTNQNVDPRGNRTPNLRVWNPTRYHCAMESLSRTASVAQWIEHQTSNLGVAGSSPT